MFLSNELIKILRLTILWLTSSGSIERTDKFFAAQYKDTIPKFAPISIQKSLGLQNLLIKLKWSLNTSSNL